MNEVKEVEKRVILRAKHCLYNLYVGFVGINEHIIYGRDEDYYKGYTDYVLRDYEYALTRYEKLKYFIKKYQEFLGSNIEVHYQHTINSVRLYILNDGRVIFDRKAFAGLHGMEVIDNVEK